MSCTWPCFFFGWFKIPNTCKIDVEILFVRYRILEPFGPLTPAQWYNPWPRPLVRGRASGLLSHGPRSRATMLDPRHVGPVILAQTRLGVQSGPCLVNYVSDGNVIAREYHISAVRYSFGEYRCRTAFRRWGIGSNATTTTPNETSI